MTKVAIDISPTINGNSKRGVGFYTSRLVSAINHQVKTNPKYKNWDISLISDSKNKLDTFDLIHYPYFDPFFLTLPRKNTTPAVVTVHDLIPLQFSQHFPVGIKGKLKWQIQKHRLLKSNYIITDSHSSKYQIHEITHYPLDRIFTIYLAADTIFQPLTNQQLLNKVQKKYQLPDKFVLYVGDINWNKNIENLVNSTLKLKIPLVVVGSSAASNSVPQHPWTKSLQWFQQQAKDHPSLIITTGFVPDDELVAIYNLATIYCQPSYAEGFGLDPLEAMQCGTPVVFSQETSLPEVIGLSGLMFNPYKKDHLASVLQKLWQDTKLQQKYRILGLKRAKTFSWKSTALQTLALYELALINEKK